MTANEPLIVVTIIVSMMVLSNLQRFTVVDCGFCDSLLLVVTMVVVLATIVCSDLWLFVVVCVGSCFVFYGDF